MQVTDLGNQQKETFTVLGAWDGDPDKGIISYLTPIGQALLNRAAGTDVEYEMEGVKKSYRIDSIDSYKS